MKMLAFFKNSSKKSQKYLIKTLIWIIFSDIKMAMPVLTVWATLPHFFQGWVSHVHQDTYLPAQVSPVRRQLLLWCWHVPERLLSLQVNPRPQAYGLLSNAWMNEGNILFREICLDVPACRQPDIFLQSPPHMISTYVHWCGLKRDACSVCRGHLNKIHGFSYSPLTKPCSFGGWWQSSTCSLFQLALFLSGQRRKYPLSWCHRVPAPLRLLHRGHSAGLCPSVRSMYWHLAQKGWCILLLW